MITGEQVKEAMIENNINIVDHHNCSFCGYMTKYEVIGGELYFDSGCYCTGYGKNHELRGFDDAARWINMQSNPDVKERLAKKFGIDATKRCISQQPKPKTK